MLGRDYHVMATGMSNRLPKASIQRWDAYQDVRLGEVEPPVDYGRPKRVFIKRRLKDGNFCYSYYISTLSLPCKGHFIALYDSRGGAEVEQFRSDKSGLCLEIRRKHNFLGLKGFVLLTDIAHNLLADFYHRARVVSRFEGHGPKRIVRDLLVTPGRLFFENSQLVRVELQSQEKFSKDLAICLVKYCSDH